MPACCWQAAAHRALQPVPHRVCPSQQEETLSTPYAVDFRLTSGHHTAGIDFPAGVYDLEAIQWCGTVTSSNDAISLDMGTRNTTPTARAITSKQLKASICLPVPYCHCLGA